MVSNPVISPETNPDRCPVIYGLTKRRAEIAGEIENLHSRMEKLRYDCANIDAVLVQFGVDDPETAIRRKRAGAAGVFHTKELPRRIMEHLKANPDGYHSRDLAAAIIADKGWDALDSRFHAAVTDKVGRSLDRLRKQGRATSVGERSDMVWKQVT